MAFLPLPLIRNLRAARTAANLTQKQLSDQLGISLMHYGRIERGERPVSLSQLGRIADYLDVSALDLLAGCFPGMPSSHTDTTEIEAILSACSAEGRRLIHDIAWLIARDYDV